MGDVVHACAKPYSGLTWTACLAKSASVRKSGSCDFPKNSGSDILKPDKTRSSPTPGKPKHGVWLRTRTTQNSIEVFNTIPGFLPFAHEGQETLNGESFSRGFCPAP